MSGKGGSGGCAEVRVRLPAFASEQLPAPESHLVREHLEGCPSCEGFLRLENAFDAALDRALERSAAPASLVAQVRRALDAEESGGKAREGVLARPWAKWALAASLAAVLIVPGAMALRSGFIRVPLAAAGVLRTMQGVLVCADCARAHLPIEQQRGCRKHGHREGFLADDGRLWDFVVGPGSRPLITDSDRIGDRLEVEGLFLGEIHSVRVDAYRYPQPAGGSRQGA